LALLYKKFPDMFKVTESKNGIYESTDRFSTSFIFCTHCRNVTMRIMYGDRQVRTRQEAEQLVTSGGYTCWQSVTSMGWMAKPRITLSLLGAADLRRLEKATRQARSIASAESDPDTSGQVFSSEIDPVLIDFANKAREKQLGSNAESTLRSLLEPFWNNLVPETRDFLFTGEVLKDELTSISETRANIDFSPAIAAYSKALEKEILEKLFKPLLISTAPLELPNPTGKSGWDRSVQTLRDILEKKRDPMLGEVAYCLKFLGCEMRTNPGNGFVRYLESKVRLDDFCSKFHIPSRIMRFKDKYRNGSVHVARLEQDDCLDARSFLLSRSRGLLYEFEATMISPG